MLAKSTALHQPGRTAAHAYQRTNVELVTEGFANVGSESRSNDDLRKSSARVDPWVIHIVLVLHKLICSDLEERREMPSLIPNVARLRPASMDGKWSVRQHAKMHNQARSLLEG